MSNHMRSYNIINYCLDVNECLTDNGGCNQTCINTGGSHQCSCWSGYELASDNHTCNGMRMHACIICL